MSGSWPVAVRRLCLPSLYYRRPSPSHGVSACFKTRKLLCHHVASRYGVALELAFRSWVVTRVDCDTNPRRNGLSPDRAGISYLRGQLDEERFFAWCKLLLPSMKKGVFLRLSNSLGSYLLLGGGFEMSRKEKKKLTFRGTGSWKRKPIASRLPPRRLCSHPRAENELYGSLSDRTS